MRSHRSLIPIILMLPSLCLADGVRFEKGLPLSPHTMIKLAKGQKVRSIRIRSQFVDEPDRTYEIKVVNLTKKQTALLLARTGQRVTWVEVRPQAVFEASCACGDVNTAVDYGKRMAVLHDWLDEHAPAPQEVQAAPSPRSPALRPARP